MSATPGMLFSIGGSIRGMEFLLQQVGRAISR
jgi:hypothetical protein